MNKVTTQTFLNNLAWIQIVIGLLFIILSLILSEKNYRYNDLCEKIGIAILTSGAFAGILKSFQFTGVFKKEIEEVMLTNKFLEKRNDVEELWHSISTNLFNTKFPEIKDELLSVILNDYFPTNQAYYYENIVYTINVDSISEENVIEFTQNIYLKGIKQEGEENKTTEISRTISVEKSQNPDNYHCEMLSVVINGIKQDLKGDILCKESLENGDLKISVKLNIGEEKAFEIETKEKRKYSIKDDNTKLFTVKVLAKEMNVSVSYPDNVKVLFFPLGVVKPFVDLHVDHPNRITKVNRNLVLPHQGFGLTFDLIEK